MYKRRRQFGFSLIEALLATGILGVGLVLIAMVFPVGVKLTGITAERTIGSIASNEAFAKIQLWGVPDVLVWPTASLPDPDNPEHIESIDYLFLVNTKYGTTWGREWLEFQYPSVAISAGQEPHKYHWSALCRALDARQVQATVFVTRKAGEGLRYYSWDYDPNTNNFSPSNTATWPSPVPVNVSFDSVGAATNPLLRRQLSVESAPAFNQAINRTFFSDNVTIVANHNGRIYRVQEYIDKNNDNIKDTLVLTEDWLPSAGAQIIWVVPPGVGSMRNPVISVVQKTLTF